MDKSHFLEEIVYTLEDVLVKASKLEKYPEDCDNAALLETLGQIETGIKETISHIKKLKRRLERENQEIEQSWG